MKQDKDVEMSGRPLWAGPNSEQAENTAPAITVYLEYPGGRRVEVAATSRHVGEGVYEIVLTDPPDLLAGARLSMVWETDEEGIRLICQRYGAEETLS
jgi:hypothetical protein